MAKRKRNPADATVSVQAKRNRRQDARIKRVEVDTRLLKRTLAGFERRLERMVQQAVRAEMRKVTGR